MSMNDLDSKDRYCLVNDGMHTYLCPIQFRESANLLLEMIQNYDHLMWDGAKQKYINNPKPRPTFPPFLTRIKGVESICFSQPREFIE